MIYGSGINAVCPAHYIDDLVLSKKYGLSRQGYVDENGNLSDLLGKEYQKLNVLNDQASSYIIKK